jgi:hypothetical protein
MNCFNKVKENKWIGGKNDRKNYLHKMGSIRIKETWFSNSQSRC